MKKQVGIFMGEVDSPYPCFCGIRIGNDQLLRFPHTDLRDLEYLVSSMRIEARKLLQECDKEEA